jgi:organic radical activating enzyme
MFDMISFLNEKIDCIVKKTNKLEEHLLKFVKRPCMEYMIINILDHCNLKCKGCDHFACIADEHFVSVEQIQKDVNRLSKIMSSDYIVSIGVMGGEPLLHPDLLLILRVIRKAFPLAIIRLTTNGILLMKQEDEFWKCCNDNRITIVNTKYPINLPYEEIEKKANEKNVYYKYFEGTELSKKSFKKQIDLNGKNDIVKSFAHCIISNYGNFLMEGKLYSCPFSCQAARIFNKKFNLNLHLSEDDYLDIYKVNNKEEIFEFAARPKYFCRYCSDIIESFEWERSNFSMNEWV